MGNSIPTASREAVAERDRRLCLRCTGPGTDCHHRKRRREKPHQHCTCNLVTLCRTCHAWAHANPERAKVEGYIVDSVALQPGIYRVKTWFGWVDLGCNSEIEWAAGP